MSDKGRIIYLDILRVLACFFVIIVHVSAYLLSIYPVQSFNFQVNNFYNTISIAAPTVFLMLSGAIFLNPRLKDISLKKLWGKYILRMVVSYVFWSYLFTFIIWFPYYTWNLETIGLFIKEFFKSGPMYHMWYIHVILSIYMVLPLLKPAFAEKSRCRYFLLLFSIFQLIIPTIFKFDIPHLGIFQNLYSRIPYILCVGHLGYFVLGYYLSTENFNKRSRIIIYVLGISGITIASIINGYNAVTQNTTYLPLSDLFALNSALVASAVFIAIRYIPWKAGRFTSFMEKLSKLTFGIYLIHPVLLGRVWEHCSFLTKLPSILGVPVVAALVFFCGSVITWCISKIPVLNKYII